MATTKDLLAKYLDDLESNYKKGYVKPVVSYGTLPTVTWKKTLKGCNSFVEHIPLRYGLIGDEGINISVRNWFVWTDYESFCDVEERNIKFLQEVTDNVVFKKDKVSDVEDVLLKAYNKF